jgi:hypothetical protein
MHMHGPGSSSRAHVASAVVLSAVLATALVTAGCGSSSGAAQPCSPAQREPVLTSRIDRLVPSDPFTVPQDARAWVTTPVGSGNTGLFGSVGGVMTVSVYAADGAPNTHVDARGNTSSGDPSVALHKPNKPVRLPVGGGRWRIYTVDLGIGQQPVTVFTCEG